MAYFIPFYIQKRLLRYALSRLEFLDTDALDLDNLDIAWGRKSTIELKDVALRKSNISAMLQLPPSLDLQHARIAQLRLTVPADLHASSIVVDLCGVLARAKLLPAESGIKANSKTASQKSKRTTVRPRSPPAPSKYNLKAHSADAYSDGSSDENFGSEDILPNPHDLAQSFLAEEPQKERERLEEAVNFRSIDPQASQVSTNSKDDGLAYGDDYGTGMALNLPTFLADFLKGIVDRLQINVSDVSVMLDVPLDLTSASSLPTADVRNLVECTFNLDIQEIRVYSSEPVSVNEPTTFSPTSYENDAHPVRDAQINSGSRCITLGRISASVTSDAFGFSQLSEVLNTPLSDRKDGISASNTKGRAEPIQSISNAETWPGSEKTPRDLPSNTVEKSHRLGADESGPHSIPFSLSLHTPSLSQENPELSVDSISQFEDRSANLHGALRKFREERSLAASKRSSRDGQNTVDFPNLGTITPPRSPVIAMPLLHQSINPASPSGHPHPSRYTVFDEDRDAGDSPEYAEADNDMLESRLYSHEEASSIYLSAMNDPSQQDSAALRVPGQWTQDPETPTTASTLMPDLVSSQQSETSMQSEPPNSRNIQSSIAGDATDSLGGLSLAGQDSDELPSRDYEVAENPENTPIAPDPASSPIASAKTLFRISGAQVWLPGSVKQPEPSFEPIDKGSDESVAGSTYSRNQHMPGSFSLYAESRSSLSGSIAMSKPTLPNPSAHTQTQTAGAAPTPRKRMIDISLDTIYTSIDTNSTRALYQLVSKLQSAITINIQTESTEQEPSGSRQHQEVEIGLNLNMNSLEVNFVECLTERSPTYSTASSGPGVVPATSTDSSLFKLSVKNLNLSLDNIHSTSSAMLDIGRFTFGFADEEILSLTRESRLRTSLHDINEVRDKDIRAEITKVDGVSHVNVVTQPFKVAIDLQKLENTLGSIGGLSGLLELGSSIMSDTTVTGISPEPNQRQRTVHFESAANVLPERPQSHQSRVNIKISGCHLTILTKTNSFIYQSSAIKVIARSTVVGFQIDDMRLSGPHQNSLSNISPVNIRIQETKMKYLFTPEEHDLTRLISLLTPSKDKFEEDDDFLVDTLIRQRKKGSILRLNISTVKATCPDPRVTDGLQEFANEISKMSAVTKFLPKESRPGVMTLGLINDFSLKFQTGLKLGEISTDLRNSEIAYVSAPSLVALAIEKIFVESEANGKLITESSHQDDPNGRLPPMLMTRMIEDELDPSVKIKMWNTCLEYSVPFLAALLDRDSNLAREDLAIDLAKSISALADAPPFSPISSPLLGRSQSLRSDSKPLKLDIALRDCSVGLNPRHLPSKALFILSDMRLLTNLPREENGLCIKIELRKSGLLLIDDVKNLSIEDHPESSRRPQLSRISESLQDRLCHQGYVNVTSISAASISVSVVTTSHDQPETLAIELSNKLFVLETCADSTQTLIETLSGLAPPARPSVGQKYRTEVAPVEDMMASFTGDAFPVRPGEASVKSELDEEDYLSGDFKEDYDPFESNPDIDPDILLGNTDEIHEDYFTGSIGDFYETQQQSIGAVLPAGDAAQEMTGTVAPDELPPPFHATASKWDSSNNRYVPVRKSELGSSSLIFRMRDTHVIWNLFDGYDWEHTRDTITKAVQDVEHRAEEKRNSRRAALEDNDEEESVIGDFLFNSIYIGIPVNADPKELSHQINGNLDDLVSETGSHSPSHASTATTSRASNSPRPRPRTRKLRLNRSKRHKITFELRGMSVDHFVFSPGGETQSSTDVQITDAEIFDHVPTSTWKKFATYMQDAGPREDRKPMLHLEICDVRPVPELTATELVVRVTILPLRLHVDQDALDFITRFFEFDDSGKASGQGSADQPYLQRVEVRPIPVKLDYKPKKVDYAGLRSGRTTEFMNFFNLDSAAFVLKHVVVYGTSGFLKLHRSLEDVWMPDVKMNQLPTVLSGLNGIRTVVNIGAGVRDLITIPIQEYKKDGRIVRSISKGALAFARTTGSELTRFGAKVAIGAQTALQGAEGFLVGQDQAYESGWEDEDLDPEEKRAISHYAHHPAGILQGIKGAARSLERDLLVTRDVIVAISGEVRESTSAEGAARAVVRQAPTLILRPVIGASKAISQTLMGATNTVDPANKRRVEDKYKRY